MNHSISEIETIGGRFNAALTVDANPRLEVPRQARDDSGRGIVSLDDALSEDRIRWAKLTNKQRVIVTAKLAVFRSIDAQVRATGNKRIVMELCKAHAVKMQGARGFSAVRLYNAYYAWARGGKHWTAIVSTGTVEREMPAEAVAFIHGWMQKNKRSGKTGYGDFIEYHWRAGFEVPGYGTWRDWFGSKWPERALPAHCPPDLPYGWTYENLIRKMDKVERALARLGIAAGLSELPPIPGTRADMRPLEWVTLDDVKLDLRVHVDDIKRPVDMVALVSLDIGNALALGFGLRPVILREDGTGQKLKRRDVKAHIVQLLQTWGFPSYGMHLILENGTATVDSAFEAALSEATGGLVQIHRAEMLSGTVWDGGFGDRAVGNSRAKAPLESWFNPMHNLMASEDGQTGRRYDVSPQDDHGRRQELAALVKAGQQIPAELRAQLKMPFPHVSEAKPLLARAMTRLNNRHDHDLKDFVRVLVWRRRDGEDWQAEAEMLTLSDAEIEQIQTDRVLESPLQRYERLFGAELDAGSKFYRLHDDSVPRLLEDQKWVEIEKGEVRFQLEKTQCLYSPYTPENRPVLEQMERGRKYLAYFDASNGQIPPPVLYLTTGDGRWIGTLKFTPGISRRDRATVQEAIATKKGMLKDAIGRVNRNAPDVGEENLERIEHNLEVIARAEATLEGEVRSQKSEVSEAPAAHLAATAAAKEQQRVTKLAKTINATKAAQEETERQQQQISQQKQRAKSPPTDDDGRWA